MPRLKLVPLDPSWISARGDSGSPLLDLHAIYRQPHKDPHTFEWVRDEAGFIEWDLSTPLPMTGVNHANWLLKGYQFVTLADLSSLKAVSDPSITKGKAATLAEPASYVQNPRTDGPWRADWYLEDMRTERAAEVAALRDDIAEFGPPRAEALRQRDDPAYRIPDAFLAAAPAAPPKKKRGRPRKTAAPVDALATGEVVTA